MHLTIFLKGQEVTKINAKSSQDTYLMYNLQFDEENWKKYRIMSKKLIFGQIYMKFAVAMATLKIIDIQLTY